MNLLSVDKFRIGDTPKILRVKNPRPATSKTDIKELMVSLGHTIDRPDRGALFDWEWLEPYRDEKERR